MTTVYIYEKNFGALDRKEKSEAQSECGKEILAFALKSECCLTLEKDVFIGSNRYGKPGFTPNVASFNISHTDKSAVCAFSDANVGVDVEMYRSVTNEAFCKKELSVIDGIRGAAAVWTAKESYFKNTGGEIGFRKIISFDFSKAERGGDYTCLDKYFHTEFYNDYTVTVCCDKPFSYKAVFVTTDDISLK
jgi:phosphopantetheinyl transferase